MKQIIRVLLLIFHQIEQRNNAQFLLKVLNGLQCFLCVGKLRLQIVMLQVELHSCLLPIAWVLIVLDFLAWRLEARPGIKPQDLKSNQLYISPTLHPLHNRFVPGCHLSNSSTRLLKEAKWSWSHLLVTTKLISHHLFVWKFPWQKPLWEQLVTVSKCVYV